MSTNFNLLDFLKDPNVINFMAGLGAQLDPSGIGGLLGRSTRELVKSRAAQQASQQTLQRNQPAQTPVQPLGRIPSSLPADTQTNLQVEPTPVTTAPDMSRATMLDALLDSTPTRN